MSTMLLLVPTKSVVTAATDTRLRSDWQPSAAVDWPKFHFDLANTGYNPYESILSPSNVGQIVPSWIAHTRFINTSPAVVRGVVYIGEFGAEGKTWTMAFDATTGTRLWRRQTFDSATSSPAVANGIVYISGLGHVLHAYNARTGEELWTVPGPTATPVVAAGVVYAGDNLNALYAFDATTGASLWKASTGYVGDGIQSAAAVANGLVYVGTEATGVQAFDAATGVRLWTARTHDVWGAPAIAGDRVYVGTSTLGANYFYALDGATGAVIWKKPAAATSESSAALANGVMIIGSDDANVYALDSLTGEQLWRAPTGAAIGPSSAAVANGVVYIGSSDSKIRALDALTGVELWSYTTGSLINGSPALVDGTLYIGSQDKNMYAFRLPSG